MPQAPVWMAVRDPLPQAPRREHLRHVAPDRTVTYVRRGYQLMRPDRHGTLRPVRATLVSRDDMFAVAQEWVMSEPVPAADPRSAAPLLRKVDAVTIPVPDLDRGLSFYRDRLGHALLWRNDALGQAGLALPDSDTEIVLTTRLDYAPSWLVSSVEQAVAAVRAAGGRVVRMPCDIPVGRLAVVADPFGTALVLLDLSKGTYTTDEDGSVTGVA